MNLKKLQSDFKIRYNRDVTPSCTFAGTPLFLLGDITPTENAIVTALSSGTALAINTGVFENVFSIQDTETNTVYTCEKERLSRYRSDTPARLIFNILGALNDNLGLKLKGAELLYMHMTTEPKFFNSVSPLLTAISILSGEEPVRLLSPLSTLGISKKELFSYKATLMLCKDRCAVNLDGDFRILPIPFCGTKTVIIKTGKKNLYLSEKINKAVCDFKKAAESEGEVFTLTKDLLFNLSLSRQTRELCEFAIREDERIKAFLHGRENIFSLINQSAEDFIKIAENDDLKLLYRTATDLKTHLAIRPLPSGAGLYAIIPDRDVDGFLEALSKVYQKKSGIKPEFYVTDTANSGMGFGYV